MKTVHILPFFATSILPWTTVAVAQLPQDTVAPGWRSTAVDSGESIGTYQALAISSVGEIMLTCIGRSAATSGSSTQNLRFASWTAARGWTAETIGTQTSWTDIDVAVNPVDQAPGVTWIKDRSLYFASRSANGQWTTTNVEAGSSRVGITGYSMSLAFDPTGKPAICYYYHDSKATYLKIATRISASTWQKQTIKVATNYSDVDLAFDVSGKPALLYLGGSGSNSTMMLADGQPVANGYSWAHTEIGTGHDSPGSMTIDAQGNLFAIYNGSDSLRLFKRGMDGARSTIAVPHPVVEMHSRPAIAVAGDNVLSSFGYYRTSGDLEIWTAKIPRQQFTEDQLSLLHIESTETLSEPEIASDPSGRVHLSYDSSEALVLTSEDAAYGGPGYFTDIMENSSKENDPNGWTTEGNVMDKNTSKQSSAPTRGLMNLWRPTERRGTEPGHSSVRSWYYGNQDGPYVGTYHTGYRNWGRLISSEIDLTTATRADLRLNHLAAMEGGNFENGEVQVSADNGRTWTTVRTSSRTDGQFLTLFGRLNSYLGKKIHLGFFVDTKDARYNNTEGWYIDDVSVRIWK